VPRPASQARTWLRQIATIAKAARPRSGTTAGKYEAGVTCVGALRPREVAGERRSDVAACLERGSHHRRATSWTQAPSRRAAGRSKSALRTRGLGRTPPPRPPLQAGCGRGLWRRALLDGGSGQRIPCRLRQTGDVPCRVRGADEGGASQPAPAPQARADEPVAGPFVGQRSGGACVRGRGVPLRVRGADEGARSGGACVRGTRRDRQGVPGTAR